MEQEPLLVPEIRIDAKDWLSVPDFTRNKYGVVWDDAGIATKYPDRPLRVVCYWKLGDGTWYDTEYRKILFEEEAIAFAASIRLQGRRVVLKSASESMGLVKELWGFDR